MRQARPLSFAELALPRILDHCRQRLLVNIADLVFRQHVMVAGVKIAVVLDHRHVAAGLAIDAQRVLHAQERADGLVEELDENLADVAAQPLIEDHAEKLAIGGGGDGARVNRSRRAVIRLYERKELEILPADLLEVAVDLRRMLDVDVVDHAEEVDVHFRFAEHMKSLDDLLVGRLLAFSHAVMVVQLSRAVETQADVKVLLGEKLTPLLVDRRAVGLNAVDEFFAFRKVFFLKVDGLAEEFNAEQRRLAAVPGKADDLLRRCLNMLGDVALEGFLAQAKVRAFGVEVFFFEVIAVVAVEVADRPDRFHHDLKFTRGSFQTGYLREPRLPNRQAQALGLYSKKSRLSSPG